MKEKEPYSPFDTVEVKKRFDVKKNYTWDLENVKGFLFYYAQDEMFLNKDGLFDDVYLFINEGGYWRYLGHNIQINTTRMVLTEKHHFELNTLLL